MKLLIDIHAHLDHWKFEKDLDDVINRAENSGLKVIISNGIDIKSNRKVLELCKKYDIMKAALGIFPIDGKKLSDEKIDDELKFIEENKERIKAIGEVGLDYHWEKDEEMIKKQKILFEKFIELAEKINKPIIIHSRNAENDCVEMIESSNIKKADFHCFNGNKALIKRIADNGYYFSIPTNIVKNRNIRDIVKIASISQIFTETDSPYLSPFQGKRNEPMNVAETIKKIAEIKNLNEEEVVNNIYMNYQRLFS